MINPFLGLVEVEDGEAERDPGQIEVIQHVLLDDEQQQMSAEVEQYYRSQQNPYFSHRPGPVYTIPESDEELLVVNTEVCQSVPSTSNYGSRMRS